MITEEKQNHPTKANEVYHRGLSHLSVLGMEFYKVFIMQKGGLFLIVSQIQPVAGPKNLISLIGEKPNRNPSLFPDSFHISKLHIDTVNTAFQSYLWRSYAVW